MNLFIKIGVLYIPLELLQQTVITTVVARIELSSNGYFGQLMHNQITLS